MLKLGLPVIYRPRVPYGRQSELFAFVTRIIDADEGRVDLITFPANSEPVHYNNIPQKSEAIQIHCWEVAIDSQGSEELKALREAIDNMQKQIVALTKGARKGQEAAQVSLHEAAAAAGR